MVDVQKSLLGKIGMQQASEAQLQQQQDNQSVGQRARERHAWARFAEITSAASQQEVETTVSAMYDPDCPIGVTVIPTSLSNVTFEAAAASTAEIDMASIIQNARGEMRRNR